MFLSDFQTWETGTAGAFRTPTLHAQMGLVSLMTLGCPPSSRLEAPLGQSCLTPQRLSLPVRGARCSPSDCLHESWTDCLPSGGESQGKCCISSLGLQPLGQGHGSLLRLGLQGDRSMSLPQTGAPLSVHFPPVPFKSHHVTLEAFSQSSLFLHLPPLQVHVSLLCLSWLLSSGQGIQGPDPLSYQVLVQ